QAYVLPSITLTPSTKVPSANCFFHPSDTSPSYGWAQPLATIVRISPFCGVSNRSGRSPDVAAACSAVLYSAHGIYLASTRTFPLFFALYSLTICCPGLSSPFKKSLPPQTVMTISFPSLDADDPVALLPGSELPEHPLSRNAAPMVRLPHNFTCF